MWGCCSAGKAADSGQRTLARRGSFCARAQQHQMVILFSASLYLVSVVTWVIGCVNLTCFLLWTSKVVSFQPHCRGHRYFPLDWVTQSSIQPGLLTQGWGVHNFSWQQLSVLKTIRKIFVFPNVELYLVWICLCSSSVFCVHV